MVELIQVATQLVNLLNKVDRVADVALPQEIVGVVKLHSKIAVASAVVPIPGVDMLAGGANIWTMYGRLNSKIGLSLQENVIKSIGAGVATNLGSYVAVSGVASALKFIPGVGSVAGAVMMGASLYAVTLVSGWVYLKALCMMVQRKGKSISGIDFKAAIDEILSNKGTIKRMFETAKKEYKS